LFPLRVILKTPYVSELGRFAVTESPTEVGAFKTSILREDEDMRSNRNLSLSLIGGLIILMTPLPSGADEFTAADLARWQAEYLAVVKEGERLFHGGFKGKNTVSCDQCHPNASNTHSNIGPVTMIQTLPLPSLRAIESLGLSDVRITLAGTIGLQIH
jgi:hypothetical protein